MSPKHSTILFKKSEHHYMQFIKTFLTMLIAYVKKLYLFSNKPSIQRNAEKQMLASLNLINHIVLHLNLRNQLLKEKQDPDVYNSIAGEVYEFEKLLLELKFHAKKYRFTCYENKEKYNRLIDQLSMYFYKNKVKIIVVDPEPVEPWFNPKCFFQGTKGVN